MCLFAGEEVGIDIQIHKKVNYERILERLVPADMVREILEADDMEKAFFCTVGIAGSLYQNGREKDCPEILRTIPMDKRKIT